MLFFKPYVIFPLKFASTFSFMTHNSSEIFQLKSCIFWTKRAHQCTIFQTFECSNESLYPIPRMPFLKPLGHRVYSIFASLFSAMKANSSIFFWLKPDILWKIHQILHVIFETTSQFLFKFCITLQSHEI